MSALMLMSKILDGIDTAPPCAGRMRLFFSHHPVDIAEAKTVCRGCPVADACRADAVAHRAPEGVWGGALFQCGVPVAARVPVGRPRKAVAP
ncbi:WhiB family transcriptional regulator [Gordonia malaquae]|uniref:WhiB family transcriptional regulator n=1 Tax=Gordonia malaquae TaxID=410332 RepID=UPI0030C7982F